MMRKFRSSVVWVLVVCLTLAPQAALAQEKGRPLDTSLLSPGVSAVAVAHPHRVLHAPAAEMLPREVFTAASLEQLGFDVAQLDRVQLYVEKPGDDGSPPNAVAVLDFLKPVDPQVVLEKLELPFEEATLEGKAICRVEELPLPVSVYALSETTIAVGTEPLLRRLLRGEAAAATHPLLKTLIALDETNDFVALGSFDQARSLIDTGVEQISPLPPPYDSFKAAPELISMAVLRFNISNLGPSGLVLVAHNEQEAVELAKLANHGHNVGREMFLEEMNRKSPTREPDAVELATQAYTQRITTKMFDAFRPVQKGRVVAFEQSGVGQDVRMNMIMIGAFTMLLSPTIEAARRTAKRSLSSNNMKIILLGMHQYAAGHAQFPPRAILSENGKPLLSWRVLLLPYVGENELYEKFHLDEPWDSEHNRALLREMPDVFKDPRSGVTQEFKTNYLLPVGKETIYSTDKGVRLATIRDGLSNTILVVSADNSHAVEWTKPADLPYDPKTPLAGLGHLRPSAFHAGFADGSVQFLSTSIDLDVLRAFFTPAGGEEVTRPDF